MPAMLDLADHDDVIALNVAAAVVAFKPGSAMISQHGRAIWCEAMRHASETVGCLGTGEASCQGNLLRAQNVHHVALAFFKRG